jgi:hypothetical protein
MSFIDPDLYLPIAAGVAGGAGQAALTRAVTDPMTLVAYGAAGGAVSTALHLSGLASMVMDLVPDFDYKYPVVLAVLTVAVFKVPVVGSMLDQGAISLAALVTY